VDGGWTENTFSFNSSFQVNQCLISFFFIKKFGGNWHSGNQKKEANATLMQRDSFGKNDPNFCQI
jgi:hypothetical protein